MISKHIPFSERSAKPCLQNAINLCKQQKVHSIYMHAYIGNLQEAQIENNSYLWGELRTRGQRKKAFFFFSFSVILVN